MSKHFASNRAGSPKPVSGLQAVTRRHFLGAGVSCLGAAALSALLTPGQAPATALNDPRPWPHFAPRAKRVIAIHLAGGPSQLELFDHKPALRRMDRQPCPDSFLKGERFAFIRGVPTLLGPQADFAQYGVSGAWVSDRLPELARVVDDLAFVKTMQTDQFNHAPAQLFLQTGSAEPGRPSLGSWAVYGLGSESADLPAFIVLASGGKNPDAGASIWGSGFLPGVFQGVQCRTTGTPILYADNPPGVSRDLRRSTLDAIRTVNEERWRESGDPEILTRIAQYETAFRMQLSVPESMEISREPEAVRAAYGVEPGRNSFANNCLLARRLAERGVRFIQLYDWGWDSHGSIESEGLRGGFIQKTRSIDRPLAALISDLKQRGLLEETLVVWIGEFGRTPMMENRAGRQNPFLGRDHHPHAFTAWLAGGGIRPGLTYGETDELGYLPVRDPVQVHDLQATILHQLGLNHERLTYHHEGRDFRLTDVSGRVVTGLLA
jgi:hypothetical protein